MLRAEIVDPSVMHAYIILIAQYMYMQTKWARKKKGSCDV